MRQILLVFVKAPTPGKVKLRLSPPLVPRQAASLYRALVEDLLERTAALEEHGVERVCAYNPDSDYPDLSWLSVAAPRLCFQRGSTLEERYLHAFDQAFATAPGGRVVAIASDIPLLPLEYIHLSFKLLDAQEVVLGPCADGGHYLIGLRRRHAETFHGVSGPSGQIFEMTKKELASHGLSYDTLPPYYDVDTYQDLTRLAKDLLAKGNGCPRTRKALEQLKLL